MSSLIIFARTALTSSFIVEVYTIHNNVCRDQSPQHSLSQMVYLTNRVPHPLRFTSMLGVWFPALRTFAISPALFVLSSVAMSSATAFSFCVAGKCAPSNSSLYHSSSNRTSYPVISHQCCLLWTLLCHGPLYFHKSDYIGLHWISSSEASFIY